MSRDQLITDCSNRLPSARSGSIFVPRARTRLSGVTM
jgi:hypothetical protein